MKIIANILIENNFVMSFLLVATGMLLSEMISKHIFRKKIPASAVAVIVGLVAAYIGGIITGGSKGLSDISIFSGLAILGGSSIRDFAIISTAYGASPENLRKSGLAGIISLFIGIIYAFFTGTVMCVIFDYTDPVDIATISSGAVSFIVGAVTGSTLCASSDVIALAIAIGLVKAIVVMILTPLIAKYIGLNNYKTAMVYGGIIGTTVGVSAGLAATDQKLVPYGSMTATFYTGLSCLICPTILYKIITILF